MKRRASGGAPAPKQARRSLAVEAADAAEAAARHAFDRCSEWIVANGGAVTALTIGTSADGLRGLHATAPLLPGTVVLHIPRRCVITAAQAAAPGTGLGRLRAALASESLHHSTSDVLLALFLLLDRADQGSFFAPYHATLPPSDERSSVSSLPVHWPQPALERLRGSRLLSAVERQRTAILEDHKLVVRCWARCAAGSEEPPPPPPTLQIFEWGLAMVSSRAFELDWQPEEQEEDGQEREDALGGGGRGPGGAQQQQSEAAAAAEQQGRGLRRSGAETAAGVVGMVPLFDLGNHKRPRDVSSSSSSSRSDSDSSTGSGSGGVTVTTLRSINGGANARRNGSENGHGDKQREQEKGASAAAAAAAADAAVCMTYGAQPNVKLLQDYGFVTLPNIEPDGSSNDILKVRLPTAAAAAASTGPAATGAAAATTDAGAATEQVEVEVKVESGMAVEVELRMASETSYTYFPFAKALDVFLSDGPPPPCVPAHAAADDDDDGNEAADADADADAGAGDGGGGGADDFEAFEAAMAAMDNDAAGDEDGGEGEDDFDMYGGDPDEADDGEELEDDGDGGLSNSMPMSSSSSAAAAGENASRPDERIMVALRELIVSLEALQAAYCAGSTSVDGAKEQFMEATATAKASASGDGSAALAVAAAAAIVLVEQCTLEFYATAARQALTVLTDDDPPTALAALSDRAKQQEQEEQRAVGGTAEAADCRSDTEQQVQRLCGLCRGLGTTRLALALLRIRCGMM
jgi:hypothetical protein